MRIKFLDIKTGKTAWKEDLSFWEVSEGNWSCDCNREHLFGNDDIITCNEASQHRYLAIEVMAEEESENESDEEVLREANQYFPIGDHYK